VYYYYYQLSKFYLNLHYIKLKVVTVILNKDYLYKSESQLNIQ